MVQLHHRYPYWGARKLRSLLLAADIALPHHSTTDTILKRHDCRVLYHSEQVQPPATHRFEPPNPNDLWQIDFKGHVPLHDRRSSRCHPLTLLDDHSCFSLCLQACEGERLELVKPHLIDVFRQYGLPLRITADNGPP